LFCTKQEAQLVFLAVSFTYAAKNPVVVGGKIV